MTNEITPTVKIGSMVKKVGIQGVRNEARERMRDVNPNEVPNRYAIGFDDSGSMSGQPITDAKKGVAGFLGSCTPTETSVAIYPFCASSQPLTSMYDVINAYVGGIHATGGTPLYTTMLKILNEVKVTRSILFSDGDPTDQLNGYGEELQRNDELAIAKAIELHVPFDTCYIGYGESRVLQEIAEKTGGIYLKFDTTMSFAKNLKYLSPRYVALLANADLKERIQRGETI